MAPPTEQDELSFKQMWESAQAQFEEVTKKSLKSVKVKTLDEVLKDLDSKFNPKDPGDGGKKARFKELASNVVTFINLLGGIAAEGASIVFGPAGLCFNALQFLIDIPYKIGKFYDDIALLFEEISTFMKQFKIYQRVEQFAQVDMELKQGTHKLMISFVEICALSIDILDGGKWKKFKTMSKIALFDNDSGVSGKLAEFRRLIDHQSRISDAVTLEHVFSSEHELTGSMKTVIELLQRSSDESSKELAKLQDIHDEVKDTHEDVKNTHEDVKGVKTVTDLLGNEANERSLEKKHNSYVEAICKKLGIEKSSAIFPHKDFDQIRTSSLPEMGSWLHNVESYNQWMDVESEAEPLLLLSGSSGTGKSNLVAVIGDECKQHYKSINGSTMRVSVAYYAYKENKKSSRGGSGDSHRATTALKSMAVQIANQSVNYAKDLSAHLESKEWSFSRDMTAEDLSKDLFPPPNAKDSTDVAYVLLFDDLDRIDDEADQLFGAIVAMKAPRTRIAVTATEDLFAKSLNSRGLSSDTIPTIKAEDHNEDDIKKYVDDELKRPASLQGEESGILRIVEHIREKLPELAHGSFSNVKHIITRVSEAVDADELGVEEILELVNEDTLDNQGTAVKEVLDELNVSLNNQEIEQLTEMLIWTMYGKLSCLHSVATMSFAITSRFKTQRPADESSIWCLLDAGEDAFSTISEY